MLVDPETIEQLASAIQETAKARLRAISKRQAIVKSEVSEVRLVHAHWMAIILVSGRDLRLTFKVHFKTDTARYFAANAYHCTVDEVSQQRALDFFREFCNLTAGGIKIILHNNNIAVGVSLPALARGFDDIFYLARPDSIKKVWRLSNDSQHIDCTLHIDCFAPLILQNLTVSVDADSGNVDFL